MQTVSLFLYIGTLGENAIQPVRIIYVVSPTAAKMRVLSKTKSIS